MSSCPICYNGFNEEWNIPKLLPCGDTCCLQCINAMLNQRNLIMCPQCIRLVTRTEIKTTPINHMIMMQIQQDKLLKNMKINLIRSPYYNNNVSPAIQRPFSALYSELRLIHYKFPSPHTFVSSPIAPARIMSPMLSPIQPQNMSAFNFSPNSARGFHSRTYTKIGYIENSPQGLLIEKKRPGFNSICSIQFCSREKAIIDGTLQDFCNYHIQEMQASLNESKQDNNCMLIEDEYQTPKKKVQPCHKISDASHAQNNVQIDYQQQNNSFIEREHIFGLDIQYEDEKDTPDFREPNIVKKIKTNDGQSPQRDFAHDNLNTTTNSSVLFDVTNVSITFDQSFDGNVANHNQFFPEPELKDQLGVGN